jgi:short subunit dehydrogenase-like uncharacterized protein
MTPENVFLYGAYGYTAKLLLDVLKTKGIAPLLGGRNAEKLQATATRHGLPFSGRAASTA